MVSKDGKAFVVDFDKALEIDPKYVIAYVIRGHARYSKKDFEGAILDFNKALEIDPKHEQSLYQREVSLAAQVATRLIKGHVDEASSDLNRDQRKTATPAAAAYNRGVAWANMGDNDKAIIEYTKVLEIEPENLNALYNRGLAWQSKGDHDSAIADYTKLLGINASDPDAFINRAVAWQNKGGYDQSIADFTKALEINPRDADAFRGRGLVWEKKREVEKALEDATKAARLDPDLSDAKVDIDRYKAAVIGSSRGALGWIRLSQQQPAASSPTVVSTKRVALLIGNSRYRHAARLGTPENDIRLLKKTLNQIGFSSVSVRLDLTIDGFRKALQEFSKIAEAADVALLYYSGHALQVDGVNYVIPVDARIRTDRDIDAEAIDANKFMSALMGAKMLRVAVLDACRDNPFVKSMRRTRAPLSIGRGLSRMEARSGEIIAFAAQPGDIAFDGQGLLSPFAESFLQRLIETPPLDVRRIFDFVGEDVLAKTAGRQRPVASGSFPATEHYYFSR